VPADRAVASPEGGLEDVREAVQNLVDNLNSQGKAGLSHSGVVKTVTLGVTDLEIYHGLGRVPTFCYPVMQSALGTVAAVTPHADPRNYINVRASVPMTANVLIS
jgi:hypothetical protein